MLSNEDIRGQSEMFALNFRVDIASIMGDQSFQVGLSSKYMIKWRGTTRAKAVEPLTQFGLRMYKLCSTQS